MLVLRGQVKITKLRGYQSWGVSQFPSNNKKEHFVVIMKTPKAEARPPSLRRTCCGTLPHFA